MSTELDNFIGRRMKNPKQKEFFDSRADDWDRISLHDQAKVEYITGLLRISDGMDVLDVGTGTGVMIPHYLSRIGSGHVTALDYSERMIEVSKGKYPESANLSYRVQDLYDIDEREMYDRVVCYSCFPHFPDPLKAVSTLCRAVREGGMFCIAHSSSKEHINHVHHDGGKEICNDYLPDMGLMVEMMSSQGMTVTFTRDDGDYYIAICEKLRSPFLPVLVSGPSEGDDVLVRALDGRLAAGG